jgi:hypothetical protein
LPSVARQRVITQCPVLFQGESPEGPIEVGRARVMHEGAPFFPPRNNKKVETPMQTGRRGLADAEELVRLSRTEVISDAVEFLQFQDQLLQELVQFCFILQAEHNVNVTTRGFAPSIRSTRFQPHAELQFFGCFLNYFANRLHLTAWNFLFDLFIVPGKINFETFLKKLRILLFFIYDLYKKINLKLFNQSSKTKNIPT